MSEADDAMSKKIETPSDAVGFLYQTFFDAGLILNPDLGFLKADNTSAFSNISDILAQLAQARLVECEQILHKMDIDLWEVCIEFHIVKAHLDMAEGCKGNNGMFTQEWEDILRNWGNGQVTGRRVEMMLEESEGDKDFRRKNHLFTIISKVHGKHPALNGIPTHTTHENTEAMLICESILPHGWLSRVNELMQELHGAEDEFNTKRFSAEMNQIPETVKDTLDDTILSMNDYDDDPTRGMEW